MLQHIGDAVLTVLEPPSGLTDVADRLVDRLRERQWDGDDELANVLEHVIGRRPSPLPPLPVELADLGEALSEQDGTENYLDLITGTVWLHTMTDFGVADDLDIDFSDETRWLFVLGEGSHEAYRDLQRFIGTVDDDDLAAQLAVAIEGRGAFGRFRSVLERDPAEFTRWHRFDADVGSDTRAAGSPITATKPDPPATGTSHNSSRAGIRSGPAVANSSPGRPLIEPTPGARNREHDHGTTIATPR